MSSQYKWNCILYLILFRFTYNPIPLYSIKKLMHLIALKDQRDMPSDTLCRAIEKNILKINLVERHSLSVGCKFFIEEANRKRIQSTEFLAK